MSVPLDSLIAFTVPGEPQSKARARVVRGHAYTPQRTLAAEAKVLAAFLASPQRYVAKAEAGYFVDATFYAYTRQRRDVDNMMKLILDALNGHAWVDDAQVVEIHGRKALVPKGEEHIEVTIYERAPLLGMQNVCAHCGKPFRSYPCWETGGRQQVWCSIPCRTADRRAARITTCRGCGVAFDPPMGAKPNVYCSRACKDRYLTVDRACVQCGAIYNQPRSWARAGMAMCSTECRVAYWRGHRAIAARGVCSICGGPTSKKNYQRCRACAIALKVKT